MNLPPLCSDPSLSRFKNNIINYYKIYNVYLDFSINLYNINNPNTPMLAKYN
jgi:hypothetical protein